MRTPLFPVGLFLLTLLRSVTVQRQNEEFQFLRTIPRTEFSCRNRPIGYYADTDPLSRCQVYHMCDMKGNKFSYLCPNGTLFHQQHLICAHFYQVNCDNSPQFYAVNKQMFPYQKFPTVQSERTEEDVEGTPQTQGPTTSVPTTASSRLDTSQPAENSLQMANTDVVLAVELPASEEAIKFERLGSKRFGFSNANANCPSCNPYFLKDGGCEPCVTIR